MTNADVQGILVELTAAQTALRDSSTAFDAVVVDLRRGFDSLSDTIAAMHTALGNVAAANREQGKAIDAVIRATNRALVLITSPDPH